MTKFKWLEETYGGRWEYKQHNFGHGGWYCDDERFVHAIAPDVDEFDNIIHMPTRYAMYKDGVGFIDWVEFPCKKLKIDWLNL